MRFCASTGINDMKPRGLLSMRASFHTTCYNMSRREYDADTVASWQQDYIAAPFTSKCYKVEGRQATLDVQSDKVIRAKQAINTQSTTTTDCACKCSINLVLH